MCRNCRAAGIEGPPRLPHVVPLWSQLETRIMEKLLKDYPSFTKGELKEGAQHTHRVMLYRQLNLSEVERLVSLQLLFDPTPASVSTLSELTGYTRRSVRITLRDFELMTLVGSSARGWELTELGRLLFIAINREARWITEGKLPRWSDRLLYVINSLPSDGRSRPFGTLNKRVIP